MASSHSSAKPSKAAPVQSFAAKRIKLLPRKRSASVVEAKAHFSSLLDEVETRRTEVTLLRRGVAVARLVPVEPTTQVTGFGWMRGSAQELGDIVGPTGEEWDANVDEE